MPSGNTCDGDAYIHNLSAFIRAHERQLANALLAYKKSSRLQQSKRAGQSNGNTTTSTTTSTVHSSSPPIPITKPVRLSMSLHHLYFLLGRLQELGIEVGPMNIRLDNIDSETSGNYVSFLSEFQRKKLIPSSDAQSIHSMSSVKSVMSSVSALWNSLSSPSGSYDNITADLRYLYSAFTKLPCLRLANDPKAKLIEGHEEYPFETATPINIFQNLVVLEICEIDPKEVYGWDFLSDNIRYMVIKKAGVVDPVDILVDLVTEDAEKRSGSENEGDSVVVDDNTEPITILNRPAIIPSPTLPSAKLAMSPPLRYQPPPSAPLSTSTPSSYYETSLLSSSSSAANFPTRRQYYYYQQLSQHRRPNRSNSILSEGRRPFITDSSEYSGSDSSSVKVPLAKQKSPKRKEAKEDAILSSSPSPPPVHWKLLKHLSFTENKISKISPWCFSSLSNLSSLDLSYNRLTLVPTEALTKLVNLKSLNLSYNRLISTHGFPTNLTKMTILNLRGNRILDLDSMENLKSLQKIDMRQNKLTKTSDLKPLLLSDQKKVLLQAIYLNGNPVASGRGYRIELFNLFNGVDYSNTLKIDGSRPGIFESRLLLDPKNAGIKLRKFLDASIINKMTASVSSMNLSKVMLATTVEKNEDHKQKVSGDNATHEHRENSIASSTKATTHSESSVLTPNQNAVNTAQVSTALIQPQKPFSVGRLPTVNILDRSSVSSASGIEKETEGEPVVGSGRGSTVSSRRASQDSNPIMKISIAPAALPVITQTTTMSTSVTSTPATPLAKIEEPAKSYGYFSQPPGSSHTDDDLIEPAILYLIKNGQHDLQPEQHHSPEGKPHDLSTEMKIYG
ncbi:DEKNAAC103995 [Brettanomyces naardenensis]|uniref:DEKNAAC103995 n=1 Tax=Brettanomyces naardenensis TaxID=13370 RepID=A0A448YQG1_BRENA|nr:DEKNAAC103995 [Brettanomyces naardenensis]